jgi:hypothetical protein
LQRSNPLITREKLLSFLNEHAIPALKGIDVRTSPSRRNYAVVEELSERAVRLGATSGRPTSLLSKLGLAICPEIFIPYDTRVREALRLAGKRVGEHAYGDYMAAVLSEKPAFDEVLRHKNFSAVSLNASEMSQSLFELRALDKRLMLRGGFSAATMSHVLDNVRW